MTYAEPTNLTTIPLLLDYANSVTDGYFAMAIVISLYLIVFIYMKLRGEYTPDCFLVAGWVTLLPSIALFVLDLLGNGQLFTVVVLFVLSMIWSYLGKSRE